MNQQEKMTIIKHAAEDAQNLIEQAYSIIIEAEEVTGYVFGFQVKQEMEGDKMGGMMYILRAISEGNEDKNIAEEIGGDEEQ